MCGEGAQRGKVRMVDHVRLRLEPEWLEGKRAESSEARAAPPFSIPSPTHFPSLPSHPITIIGPNLKGLSSVSTLLSCTQSPLFSTSFHRPLTIRYSRSFATASWCCKTSSTPAWIPAQELKAGISPLRRQPPNHFVSGYNLIRLPTFLVNKAQPITTHFHHNL
jgi:hypothetical protein